MTYKLPDLSGLKMAGQLGSGKGLDLKFTPSMAIVAGSVDKLGLDIRSFREPLKQSLKEVILPSIKKNFDVEGRPSWDPLSPFTLAQKEQGSGILVRSGRLKRVMGYQNNWKLTKDYLVLEDLPQSVWYGKVHQKGIKGASHTIKNALTGKESGSFDDTGLPARPFVALQPSDRKAIESIFRHWLDMRMKRAALRIKVAGAGARL